MLLTGLNCSYKDTIGTPSTGALLWAINHYYIMCPVAIMTREFLYLQ